MSAKMIKLVSPSKSSFVNEGILSKVKDILTLIVSHERLLARLSSSLEDGAAIALISMAKLLSTAGLEQIHWSFVVRTRLQSLISH